MNFEISSAINKMKFVPRELGLLASVSNNTGARQVSKSKIAVKSQTVKAKAYTRKILMQKPDKYVPVSEHEIEVIPNRLKRFAKIQRHKRTENVVVSKKYSETSTPLDDYNQEILDPLLSKEEEKSWIEFVTRNNNDPLNKEYFAKRYSSEIETGNVKQKAVAEGYEKALETKTGAYFDEIKADEKYRTRLFWKDVFSNFTLVSINNRLRLFFKS